MNPLLSLHSQNLSAEFGQFAFHAAGGMNRELTHGELIRSLGEEKAELVLTTNAGGTYRKVPSVLSLVQHRDESSQIKSKTLVDFIVRTGKQMTDDLLKQADDILMDNGIDPSTLLLKDPGKLQIRLPDAEDNPEWASEIGEIAAAYNVGKSNDRKIRQESFAHMIEQHPDRALYVCPDDVGVRHQRIVRAIFGHTPVKGSETVQNTVIHVSRGKKTYTITAPNRFDAYKMLVAFALENGLKEGVPLIFFADGAEDIRKAVAQYFAFYPHQLLLDWFHLSKKMRERISSAFYGSKEEKRQLLKAVNSILWAGNTDDAVAYYEGIDRSKIRNRDAYDKVIGYLQKHRTGIYSYALRKQLGYLNSSNRGEKDNDLIVAQRQKHNGMAWSYEGSGALAMISSVRLNGWLDTWLEERHVPLAFAG